MTEYTKQAVDFLKSIGAKMTAKFIAYKPHFQDDKESRDVFRVTFSRPGRRFSLSFGQSLNDSTGRGDKPPTAYDVLACIQKYDPGTFDNFCGDFGYDTDSRKAERIYKAVLKEWAKVEKFFAVEELDKLNEIR